VNLTAVTKCLKNNNLTSGLRILTSGHIAEGDYALGKS